MNKKLKVTFNGFTKKMPFPKDFDELLEKTKTLTCLPKGKKFHFYEKLDNDNNISNEIFEIKDQNDLEKLLNKNADKENIKIYLELINDRNEDNPQNNLKDLINDNGNIINDNIINSINSNDDIKSKVSTIIEANINKAEKLIVDNIYNSIQQQIVKNTQLALTRNSIQNCIHKGIKCDICHVENFSGPRYKCVQCDNFNLCSQCEAKNIHDQNHILIKINQPLEDESLLNERIDKDLKYDVNYNFSIEPLNFILANNSESGSKKLINIKNTGNENWKRGFYLKCIKEESELEGTDTKLNVKLLKNNSNNVELKFGQKKDNKIIPGKVYNVFYKMLDDKGEQFGERIKFEIIFDSIE